MLSFILIFLSVLLYGAVHSFLASLRVKKAVRRRFGPEMDRYYRLAYNLFAVLSLFPVLALPAVLPDRPIYRIPAPWSFIAVAGQLLALLALAVGVFQTGALHFFGLRQLVETKPEPQRLQVSGLYRYVRHPLYTAGLALIWLLPVMTTNLLAINLGLSLYLVVGARFEEQRLLREYGLVYATYRRRTPMLFPKILESRTDL